MENIIKVQVSIFSSSVKSVLLYNEDHSIMYEEPASKELLKRMKGELKKYFYYELEKAAKGYHIVLLNKAPDQNW